MIVLLLVVARHFSAHGAHAQLANFDKSDELCRDLGHCRSIWDIIWSCLATIFLCAWVSLHPNIPTQGKGWLWKLWRRAVAFGIALVAPEYIIGLAYNQRAVAKEIAAEYKHHKWTLTHGFFANMGGFVVRGTNGKDHVLHPDDIDAYLRNGQINMTEDEIQDKSKGDMLTKGFVVLQTTWFILQLIARAIQHLPVTELEIATLGFAILNGATYALWWSKPLDVQCPIVLIDHVLAADTETGADGSMGSDGMGGDHAYGGMRDHLIKQKHSQISRVSFLAVGVR